MKRSEFAADLLVELQACLGARCNEYAFLRSRGLPPADCNSIALTFRDRDTKEWPDCGCSIRGECPECLPTATDPANTTFGVRIVLTRICMRPDAGDYGNFDPVAEDREAACFWNDLEALEDCLQCNPHPQLAIDHSIEALTYVGTFDDVESEGGGYSSYIDFDVEVSECC